MTTTCIGDDGEPYWPLPTPLLPRHRVPTCNLTTLFPPHLTWAASYANGVAEEIQVPVAMVVPMMLSITSLVTTHAVEFHGKQGHTEAPVIWTMTVAAPGERKSPVLRRLLQPLDVAGQFSLTVPAGANREQQMERSALLEALGESPLPRGMQLITSDLTPAGAQDALVDNQGRLGVISDEGAVIGQLVERGRTGLDIFLKGWSGDPLIARRRDHTQRIEHPEVVLGLLVQHAVARQMLTSDALISRGFPQRFLFSMPGPSRSRSYASSSTVKPAIEQRWTDAIVALHDLPRSPTQRRAVRLDPAALTRFASIADDLDQLHDAAADDFRREWLSKAHGQVLRIAGIFALLTDPDTTTISVADVDAAHACIIWHIAHLDALVERLGPQHDVTIQAKRVLRYLRESGSATCTTNEISQTLRSRGFSTVADWTPVFDLLLKKGWLRRIRMCAGGERGGRPSWGVEVHPSLFRSLRTT